MADDYQIQPPADVPEVMHCMWYGCLMWAASEPDILAWFKDDTGISYPAARSPLDAMIDKATGYDQSVCRRFVEWFNANVWGPWDGPDSADASATVVVETTTGGGR
jgi:hypothetical protein